MVGMLHVWAELSAYMFASLYGVSGLMAWTYLVFVTCGVAHVPVIFLSFLGLGKLEQP